MPSFFYQRNVVDPAIVPEPERSQNVKFQDAEVNAIVSYLFEKSTHRTWQAPRGRCRSWQQLVESVGCMGRHVSTEQVKDETSGQFRLAKREDFPWSATTDST